MSSKNDINGKDYVLEYFDPATATYKKIGGINNRDMSMDNPTVDVTSQSTSGDISENSYAGYSDFNINGSGIADTRNDAGIAGYKLFSEACMTGDREVTLRLSDPFTTHTADFVVSNYAVTGEERGKVTFTMTAVVASNYTRV